MRGSTVYFIIGPHSVNLLTTAAVLHSLQCSSDPSSYCLLSCSRSGSADGATRSRSSDQPPGQGRCTRPHLVGSLQRSDSGVFHHCDKTQLIPPDMVDLAV